MAGQVDDVVEAYIAKQPREPQLVLQRVRRIIRKVLPGAEETISYQIPTYKVGGRGVVAFAGWKRHWSLYPVTESVRAAFGSELAGYEFSKGTLRFPLAAPVPTKLVERIVRAVARRAVARREAKARTTSRRDGGHGRQGVSTDRGASRRRLSTGEGESRGFFSQSGRGGCAGWDDRGRVCCSLGA